MNFIQEIAAGPYTVPCSDPTPLRLRLIGAMSAYTSGNQSVLPIGRKTRGLLAILALSAPRPVVRSRLAELLWSRRLEEQARASLRQEIHRLLDALHPIGADILRVTRDHIALRSDVVWIDVHQVRQATAADPSGLTLMTEPLLEEFDGVDPAFDQWLIAERAQLRDQARTVAEAVMQQQVGSEAAIPVAQQLLAIDRGHEGAWRVLIQAYAERGERGTAIQCYERCRTALAESLSAAPSAETLDLVAQIRTGQPPAPASPAQTAPAIHRSGAKVGVLPLQVLSSGGEERDLALGLAEEITGGLARFRWMSLASSASLAQSGTRDGSALRQRFGLDFLLDGSVQRVGRRLRITVQLLDLCAGNHIVWARRFDRQINDLLSLQDEIAAEIVAQADPELILAEARRAAHRGPLDTTAYEKVLQALPLITPLRRDGFMQAGALLNSGLAQDPGYAAAHAWRAYWAMLCLSQNWADDAAGTRAEAAYHSEQAILLDARDGRNFAIAGLVRAYVDHRPETALELHARALSLNPNLPMAWGFSALTFVYLGDLEEAARRFGRYRRLRPLDHTSNLFKSGVVLLDLMRRDYQAAILSGRRVAELRPNLLAGLQHYVAALGHAGATGEAADVLGRLLAIQPGFSVNGFLADHPFARPGDAQHYADGLRLAGVPVEAI